MIKKTLFIGGGLLLLLALLFGRNAFNYVTTMVGSVRERVDDGLGIDFHLKRARKKIAKFAPEIRRNKGKVAKEEVAVEKLQIKVDAVRSALAKSEKDILRLSSDLDSGKSSFVYAKVNYTAKEVEGDLARRFQEFKEDKAHVKSLEQVLNARLQGLRAAKEKLAAMQSAQQKLRVRVANLEARMQMVEVAQTSTEFTFNDNHLTETRDLIDELESRIRTAEKLVKVDPKLRGHIPLEEEEDASGQITAKINAYFGNTEKAELAESVE